MGRYERKMGGMGRERAGRMGKIGERLEEERREGRVVLKTI